MIGSTSQLTVIGVDSGPLPVPAQDALAAAELVIGESALLARHAPDGVRTVELGPLEPALSGLNGTSAVLLAAGDPGFFGLVRAVRAQGIRAEVIPATSSVQRLLARVGRSWDDVTVVSASEENLKRVLNVCRARPAVAVLTTAQAGPAEIGRGLTGWRRTLVVAEDLGGEHEEVSTVDVSAAASRTWREPNLLLCLTDPDAVPAGGWISGGEPAPAPGGWALAEDEFAHRDGMVTAAEVRAVVLARLAPRPGSLIWDVGAGSGAVAVESGRLGAATVAVERDEMQCVRIIANAATHGVDVRVVEGAAPEALAGLPHPDAIYVGGGGFPVVEACARIGADRVVLTVSALDRVGPARDSLRQAGYTVAGCQLSVSRLVDGADRTSRLAAQDSVFVLWGNR